MAKAKSGWEKCEICGAKMRAEKLSAHNRRVHPKGAKTQEERQRIEGRRRTARGTAKWLIATIIVVVVIFVVYIIVTNTDIRGSNVGDKPYNFKLTDQHNLEFDLDDYLGEKPVLFVFAQVSCPNCQEEMPILNTLYETYGDAVKFVVIISSPGKKHTEVVDWANDYENEFQVLHDKDGLVFDQYKLHYFPTIFLTNKEGKIQWKTIGKQDEATLEKHIKDVV